MIHVPNVLGNQPSVFFVLYFLGAGTKENKEIIRMYNAWIGDFFLNNILKKYGNIFLMWCISDKKSYISDKKMIKKMKWLLKKKVSVV